MRIITGFPPIVAANGAILILGSMPSETSLKHKQYYAHQRNAFWPIMGSLFGAFPEMDYPRRKNILQQNGIAVWDVLKSCFRPGSMDANIDMAKIEVNNFAGLFAELPMLERVYFNGGTADKTYRKQVLPNLEARFSHIQYHRLPSTSPAYAAMTLQEKTAAWSVIKR